MRRTGARRAAGRRPRRGEGEGIALGGRLRSLAEEPRLPEDRDRGAVRGESAGGPSRPRAGKRRNRRGRVPGDLPAGRPPQGGPEGRKRDVGRIETLLRGAGDRRPAARGIRDSRGDLARRRRRPRPPRAGRRDEPRGARRAHRASGSEETWRARPGDPAVLGRPAPAPQGLGGEVPPRRIHVGADPGALPDPAPPLSPRVLRRTASSAGRGGALDAGVLRRPAPRDAEAFPGPARRGAPRRARRGPRLRGGAGPPRARDGPPLPSAGGGGPRRTLPRPAGRRGEARPRPRPRRARPDAEGRSAARRAGPPRPEVGREIRRSGPAGPRRAGEGVAVGGERAFGSPPPPVSCFPRAPEFPSTGAGPALPAAGRYPSPAIRRQRRRR